MKNKKKHRPQKLRGLVANAFVAQENPVSTPTPLKKPFHLVGKKNALKLRTVEERLAAYADFCDWISKGFSRESWVYHNEEISVCYRTLQNYFKEYPDDFDRNQEHIATANSLQVWELMGKKMMLGEIQHCQPVIFQMFMRNKFGWDKDSAKNEERCAADDILDRINNREIST